MAFPRRSRLPADISPEERERRIAELRERRHRRLRVLAIRSALATGALVVLGAVLLYWLLTTFGGRDFLLARIVAALPAGTELTWARAEGPASGPLVLHGLRYVQRGCPDVDGEPVAYGQCARPTVLTFSARRVVLDPAIAPLIGRRLRLDALDVDGAALDLPEPADTPFELPTWPEVLPRIDLPLSLQADTIRVDGLRVTRSGQALIDIATIRGGLDARQGELRIAALVIDSDLGRFAADGVYAPDANYRTDLTASALLPASFPRPRPRIGLVARGDLDLMDVAVVGHAPEPLRLALALRGRQWSLRADSDAFDPALLTGGEAGEPMAFSLQADGQGGAADARGELRRGTLHAVLQPSKLKLEEQVLELQPLVLDVFDGRVTARGRGDFSEPRAADFRFAVNARGLRLGGDPQAHDPEPADPAPAIGIDADLGIAGTSRAWAVIGKADLARDALRAQVELDGRGDLETLRLATLRATTPGGRLDATGEVGWAPALRWTLDATLAGGKASIPIEAGALPVGVHRLPLGYVGDDRHDSSTGTVTVTVTAKQAPTQPTPPVPPAPAKVDPTLKALKATGTVGQKVRFKVRVKAGDETATGWIKVRVKGSKKVQRFKVKDGTAVVKLPAFGRPGTKKVVVRYLGDDSVKRDKLVVKLRIRR